MSLDLGLTGANSAGKGEVAQWLASRHGYHPLSLSDILRGEARRRGLEPTRDVLVPLGNELRRDHGPGVLAHLAVEQLRHPGLVDSIRNPEEVAVLRAELPGFVLVAVEAPVELRFRRSRERRRPGDPDTLEGFVAAEERENSADPASQQLRAVVRLADRTLVNDGSLEDLRARVDRLVEELAGG